MPPRRAVRILALSDAPDWEEQHNWVRAFEPGLVVLAGDLTDDGFARCHRLALEAIPAYRRARQALDARYPPPPLIRPAGPPQPVGARARVSPRERAFAVLTDRYCGTPAYHAARRRLHVRPFYEFLAEAGRHQPVLVVQGDHDREDYRPERINRIPGCTEISGRVVTVDGWIILGIGARQAAFLSVLRELTAAWCDRTDLIVSHVPRRRLPLVTALRPRRLLVQGHSETGLQRQDGVLIAGTVSLPLVIDLGPRGALRIQPADPGRWWCPWRDRDEALARG